MDNEEIQKNMSDHDSLVTLVADVHNLRKSQEIFHAEIKGEFKDLKDNYSVRINKLEESKLDKSDHADHESRLRELKTNQDNNKGEQRIFAIIMSSVISIVVALVVSWLKTKI